ncbi:MAG TPA: leucyl aminopeptidase, partial [Actinomycetota bacterium]|nr:leucyl aminopeptidase [Actinomycetota bacterium]
AVSDHSPAEAACDVLVVGAHDSDDGPRLTDAGRAVDDAMGGNLGRHLEASNFTAKVGKVVLAPTLGAITAPAVAVAGLGCESDGGSSPVRRAAAAAARALGHAEVVGSTLQSDGSEAAAAEGYLLGAYRFTAHKTSPGPDKLARVLFLGAQPGEVARGVAYGSATTLARDLINEPPSLLTPAVLASRAVAIAEAGGLSSKVWDEEALTAEGFDGILSVGRASAHPPRFIRLDYEPTEPRARLALIGKGVTFDSGGLSLKDARNMETMKTDMSGAAAVIAAMSALPTLRPQVHVIGLVPATENMPGGDAMKPGDVIKHYGGTTSEVLNTDAEGRLILADALSYASQQKVDAIVDVATLTGAIMVALGAKCTGLFSNDDSLAQQLQTASESEGERNWRMPLFDDYARELESEIADIKHIGSRWGGAIFAALFLRRFVGKDIPWAHLDIAGTARSDSSADETSKGGTGSATRTLLAWIEGRART